MEGLFSVMFRSIVVLISNSLDNLSVSRNCVIHLAKWRKVFFVGIILKRIFSNLRRIRYKGWK